MYGTMVVYIKTKGSVHMPRSKAANDKDRLELGKSYAGAMRQLKTDLLYSLANRFGVMKCYHCGKHIGREEMSIEHKLPWRGVSPELFWDLDNVGFSHLLCNIGTTRQNPRPLPPPQHGKLTTYNNHKCRCIECTAASSTYQRNRRAKRKAKHGI